VPAIGLAIVACSTACAATMTCNGGVDGLRYLPRSAATATSRRTVTAAPRALELDGVFGTVPATSVSAAPDALAALRRGVERGRAGRGRLARHDLLLCCHHCVEGAAAAGRRPASWCRSWSSWSSRRLLRFRAPQIVALQCLLRVQQVGMALRVEHRLFAAESRGIAPAAGWAVARSSAVGVGAGYSADSPSSAFSSTNRPGRAQLGVL
jgi:hypothetical protein